MKILNTLSVAQGSEELEDPHRKVHIYVYIYLPISVINVNLLSEQPLNMNHKLSRFTY